MAILTGWAKLASTNFLSAGLSFLATVVAARALGLAEFGLLAVVIAYARVIDGLFNFQSVTVLTRFLTEAEHAGDDPWFRGLIKAGFLVDGLTAVFSTLIAVGALVFLGGMLDLPADWIVPAMLFCLVILTRIFGVTEAVLRCFDAYWAIGLRGTIGSALLLLGVVLAWQAEWSVFGFVAVWAVSEAIANLLFLAWTFRMLRMRRLGSIWQADMTAALSKARGFWRQLWQTNVTFGVRILSQDADMLVANTFLGPAAAGLLKVAKDLAGIASQFGRPIQQAASPHLTKLLLKQGGQVAVAYSFRISLMTAAPVLVVAVLALFWAEPFLIRVYGAEFGAAGLLVAILLVSNALYLAGVCLLPMTTALDLAGTFLVSILVSTGVFLACLVLTTPLIGLTGIAIAHIAFNATWLLFNWPKVHRRGRAYDHAASVPRDLTR